MTPSARKSALLEWTLSLRAQILPVLLLIRWKKKSPDVAPLQLGKAPRGLKF